MLDVTTPAASVHPSRLAPVRGGNHRYWIVPAQVEHVYTLAVSMRQRDADEIAGLGVSAKKTLWRAYKSSVLCKSVFVDNTLAAMWGLCLNWRPGVSCLSDLGVPWLHTSDAIEKIPLAFVKHARAEVATMRTLRPRLESYVAADYDQAIRFLGMIGFTLDKPEPIGVNGASYCRFHIGFS